MKGVFFLTVKSVLEDKKRKIKKIISETYDAEELKELKKTLLLINKELKEIDACQEKSKNR